MTVAIKWPRRSHAKTGKDETTLLSGTLGMDAAEMQLVRLPRPALMPRRF